jgi:hypothetical protein
MMMNQSSLLSTDQLISANGKIIKSDGVTIQQQQQQQQVILSTLEPQIICENSSLVNKYLDKSTSYSIDNPQTDYLAKSKNIINEYCYHKPDSISFNPANTTDDRQVKKARIS